MKRELAKMKLAALVAIILAIASVPVLKNCTACVFILAIAVPCLFAKKEWLDW